MQTRLTMTEVVVVLLDVVYEALLRQSSLAELDDEWMPDIRAPQWQVGLDEMGCEGVWIVCGRPGHQIVYRRGKPFRCAHGGIERVRVR